MAQLVAAKAGRTLVVCGCWSQEHGDAIRARWPEVDVVAGVGQFDRVVAACTGGGAAAARATADPGAFPLAGPPIVDDPLEAHYVGMLDRPLLTPPHVAFVKIGEGCNFSCTFCRIPLIRGKQRSRPVAEIAEEVRRLADRGVSEIQLVSQNTSDFGRDTGENLLDLVRTLDAVPGLQRAAPALHLRRPGDGGRPQAAAGTAHGGAVPGHPGAARLAAAAAGHAPAGR